MTARQKETHINDIMDTLKNNGWQIDRWGNFRKDANGRAYRVKMQKTSLRLEVKVGDRWINSISDYFKNIGFGYDCLVVKGKEVK